MIYRARLIYWAMLVAVLFAVAATAKAEPPKLEPFIGYTHVSDVLTGRPFLANPTGCEPTTDWVGAGATIVWPRVEVDLAHGIKQRDAWCGRRYAGKRESGTLVTMRWYPWRNR